MNLLPKSHTDFSQKEYWNTFFKKRGKKAFEWYGEYPELCGQLHKYAKPKDEILVVGCGNSSLSADLYDVGYRHITNIDISPVVIRQMNDTNRKRPELKFLQMDALSLQFPDDSFSVVLDKGTLDALMPDDSAEVQERIDKFFGEISRVLKLGGRYICVSLLQEHIIRKVLRYFATTSWMVRVVRCHEAERKSAESGEGNTMPVFVLVITKFKQLPQLFLEVCMGGETMQRLSSPEQILEAVRSAQDASLVTNGLVNNSLVGLNEVKLDLSRPGDATPRYTIHVLDQTLPRSNGRYAAFIVSQGREADWLFSTPQGRKQLLQSAGYERLAVVSMHRDHVYTDLEAVNEELADSIKSLAPRGIKGNIPYLSLGNDVGERKIIHKGHSEFSGDYVVEDVVHDDGNTYRRLIFLNNQLTVQSEAKMSMIKNRHGKKKLSIDTRHLACEHHKYMSVGVAMATAGRGEGRVAVVGLGGGGLCSFLRRGTAPRLSITAVDIDPAMLHVAQQHFGLVCDEQLTVCIDDGIKFIERSASNGDMFDAVLFDVDSKDMTLGMSCPPKQFIQEQVLKNVQQIIGEKGFFILNLVCRDDALRKEVVVILQSLFKHVASYSPEQEVNEVVFCTANLAGKWPEQLKAAAEAVNACGTQNNPIIDITSLLESLNIL